MQAQAIHGVLGCQGVWVHGTKVQDVPLSSSLFIVSVCASPAPFPRHRRCLPAAAPPTPLALATAVTLWGNTTRICTLSLSPPLPCCHPLLLCTLSHSFDGACPFLPPPSTSAGACPLLPLPRP